MRFKINVLITSAVVIFIALSSMQYYLVKTAYEYKVTQFRIEVKDKIAQITDNFNTIDSASFSKKDVLYKQLAEAYFSNPTPKLELKNKILNNTFKGALTAKLEQEFSNEFPNHKIEFVTVLNKFVLYNSNKENDSIFSEKPNIKNAIYGNLKTLKEAFLIRNYVGTTSGFVNNLPYKLLTEDALYVSVKNWELIILKRMALLLSFAILSIMALITMFIVVLKALIKQKNIK